MARIKLALRAAVAALGFALYVWFAAVRFVPGVKRRKAARRRERGQPAAATLVEATRRARDRTGS